MKSFLLVRKGHGTASIGFVFICMLSFVAGCGDIVTITNTSGNPVGLLVDGQSGNKQVNDFTVITNSSIAGVGQLSGSPSSNEIIAFTNRRPVAIKTNVPWTAGDDNITMAFANEITIPVKVWIVKGPFETQRLNAINACITTTSIWNKERMGVAFSPFEIVDATANPKASNYFAFDCTKKTGIETDIGKTAGRINIYFVDTVDGGTGRGQACAIGSDFVAVGSAIGSELLSHELGHDFGLTHIDDLTTDFDQTNIMHSASNTRQFITEGQLFRAHLSSNSALNFLYNARPGQPTRDCPRDMANNQCPRIQKRIWADGAFPAN